MDVLPLDLVGDGALRAAVAADREVTRLEGVRSDHLAQYLGEVALDWVPPTWTRPGGEQPIRLGGPGTPKIPEFAVCEVATALGLTQPAATMLCADVLDLAYRLRRIAVSVRAGVLSFTRARMIARRTRELSVEQVELVQERLCRPRDTGNGPVPMAAQVPMSRLRTVIDQAVVTVRGPDSQEEAEARVAASLFVEVVPTGPGAADVAGRLASADATRLDRRLDEVAGWLTQVGDTRPKAILRAVALGLLADPALLQALTDLRDQHPATASETAASNTAEPATSPAPAVPGEPCVLDTLGVAAFDGVAAAPAVPAGSDEAGLGAPAPAVAAAAAGIAGCPAGVLDKLAKLTSTVLYLHLDQGSGTWCEEQAGVLTPAQARELVGHSNVTIRPVLDLAADLTYTGYVAPSRLKEQLALLNAGYCTYPHCHRRARAGDVDHQIPDARGGATASRNTHRLCRKHHRAKDKAGWRVVSPAPGLWIWTSPAGAIYLVSNATTTLLNGIFSRTNTPTRPNPSRRDPEMSKSPRDDAPSDGSQRDPDIRGGVKNWSPSWDPWHDPDPLTETEHEFTYRLINTG